MRPGAGLYIKSIKQVQVHASMNPSTASSVASLGNIGRWAVAPLLYRSFTSIQMVHTHNFRCEPEQQPTLKCKNIEENMRTCFRLWVCALCRGCCSLRDLTNNRMHSVLQRKNLHSAIKPRPVLQTCCL